MKLHALRVAASLTAAMATAVSPLLASAQTAYEYKKYTPGLGVMGIGSGQAPGSGENGSPLLGLRLSANAINFGDVATNTTETRQVLVSNTGAGSLSFSAAPTVMGDAAFAAGVTSCGETLAVGADCLAEAAFSPTSVGTYSGVLQFTPMLATSPHAVTLLGTAFNPVSLGSITLPPAMVGRAYSYDFKALLNVSNEASPDKSQATWSGSGTLPTGLSLNTGTGLLTGTPSMVTPGTAYTVTGTYKNNKGQQVYTLVVNDAVLEVTQIAVGQGHACAVTTSGGVKCWGHNTRGQLGDGSLLSRASPVNVIGLSSGVLSIAAGPDSTHTCAVNENGTVFCWGDNGDGQLGDGSTVQRTSPVAVANLTGVSSMALGANFSCALTGGGGVKCWGRNGQYQLGNGSSSSSTAPENVSGLSSGVTSLTAGANHACAVVSGGAAKCWGYNAYNQLGDGTTSPRSVPTSVAGLSSGVVSISAGSYHSCAVTSAGGAKCWGYNGYGQLGDSSNSPRASPVDVAGMTTGVFSVSAGGQHTCAVLSDRAMKCWGYNQFGQLGDGTATTRNSPVSVLGLTNVAMAAGGAGHTCAVTSSGAAKCWGSNSEGRLGDGTGASRSAPVNVLP